MAVRRLLPIEKVSALYAVITSVLMLVLLPRLVDPVTMVLTRVEWLIMTVALVGFSVVANNFQPGSASLSGEEHSVSNSSRSTLNVQLTTFLRTVGQMVFLILWYPDTYEFNRSFANLDHHFAALDLRIFGCQPSLEFSRLLPGSVWSEAFNLGYWSYFPMIVLLSLSVLFVAYREAHRRQMPVSFSAFSRVTTTIMGAFFLFYFIYIFLPVAGPQFYFQAVGVDEIVQGHFPALGTYFSSHTDMFPAPGDADGLFYHLVSGAQATGERPTAAFPSSHIGISTILLLLARRHVPRLLCVLMPLWALLCCATVYIQAHYLVDAIAGLLSAPLVLWLVERLLRPLFRQEQSAP